MTSENGALLLDGGGDTMLVIVGGVRMTFSVLHTTQWKHLQRAIVLSKIWLLFRMNECMNE